MADEQDTKTSFVESKTSGHKVKCGIRVPLLCEPHRKSPLESVTLYQ